MAPGIDGLLAAERDIDVSGPVAEFLRSLAPPVLLRLRLGLRAFEWLPFPWRFSRLEPEAADEFLAKLEGSSFSLHHDLLLMAKILSTLGYAVAPGIEAKIGVRTDCALADGTLPEPAGSLGDTEAHGEGEECEVAIVGSGAGGAVAAAMLAEAGIDVLVLEAGAHYNRENYPAGRLEAIAELYREAGLTIAEGRPAIPVPVAKVVGGTTVINSGTC
ncbi:MAG TPA: FAD-dependent monooxygenase, partial [Solirubrobacterales bacterium]|nr:FAD-dependent monooxygenase [Solirubrobacterales bacterium]